MLTCLRTIEDQIIKLYQQGLSQEIIATRLKTGKHRVNRCIKIFRTFRFIPVPLHPGCPRKVTDAILDFIHIRTVQNADLSAGAIGDEIKEYFHMKLSKSKINQIRHQLHCKYQPPRHTQKLTDDHVSNRVEFCKKMLGLPSSLPLIHFSDESRIVLGDDKQWIWYRRGENNDSATLVSMK
jgi:transposase